MGPLAPLPRYRLYTSFVSYYWFFRDMLLGRLGKGTEVDTLESEIIKRFNVLYATTVPMARVGIYLTLKHLIRPGQKVILSPYTIADVINMVIAAGGHPLFADIDRKTCNIDPNQVRQLLSPEVGAVLITHLHGLAAPVKELKQICDAAKIPLVEDSAQAFGAMVNGQRTGTFGRAGIFSLGTYKNINTWYGGVVVSNDKELIDAIKADLSSYPLQSTDFISKKVIKSLMTDLMTWPALFKAMTFWVFRFGFLKDIEWINKKVRTELDTSRRDSIPKHYLSRLTPFQGRLALCQLDLIDSDSENRIRTAQIYYEGLKDLPDLTVAPPPDGKTHIYTYYPIQYQYRDNLIKWMMQHRCDVAAQHLKNCADLPGFSEFHRPCPNARATAEQVILLPTYPRYSPADVQRNIDIIRKYFAFKKK